jgi:large subunit ribosomal protein L23
VNLNTADILRRPRITEKSVFQQNAHGHYTFQIHPDANKQQVKEAVQRLFDVKVTAVKIQNYAGKTRRTRMGSGQKADWKKAIVVLASGQTLEGV